MPFPNFIIIGPPKCGTTSVFDWLSKHPDTCPSKVKETNYFLDWKVKGNQAANFTDHGLSRYNALFSLFNGESIIFESSPAYLRCSIPLGEFARLNPVPFILYIYRDPTERLYSDFRFSKFKTRSFKGNFATYCGDTLKSKNVENGKIVTQINQWIRNYDREKILIYHFDDLKNDPKKFMKSLCQDLSIDPDFYTDFNFDVKNKTVVLRNKKIHYSLNKLHNITPDWAKNLIVPIYRRLNQTELPKPTREDLEIQNQLREIYKDETWENISGNIN